MPDIDIRRAHNLGLKAARSAADEMAKHLQRKFGLQGGWSGDVLHFERPGVSGALAVDDKDLRLTVTLGFLLKAMRGAIEGAVHEELDNIFAKAPSPRPATGKADAKPKKAAGRPKKGG